MSIWTEDQLKAAAELASRRVEAIKLFRATKEQAEILKCTAREMLVCGGNRSGKSTICAVRMASILLNQPVITEDGEEIYCRLPWQQNRKLRCWVIGLGESHIGQTIYRLLFEPGLFKIIRDENTGDWRAFHPWEAADEARESESRPSPPLIPKRYIKPKESNSDGFVWSNRGAKVFEKVEFWNPIPGPDGKRETLSELFAFTSSGDVKAGDPVDEIWIDEKIKYETHYPEWQARLIDRKGRISWSSWPAIDNEALIYLKEAAEKSEENGDNLARMFTLVMSQNKHLDKESRADAIAGWRTENDRRARDRGEFVTDSLRLYPGFSQELHSAINDDPEDKLSNILKKTGGVPPVDWTVDLILDPGTENPGVLLCAVPPPEFGDFLVPYQEIYKKNKDAKQIARLCEMATRGRNVRRMIIDGQAGRQKPMGFGNTIQSNYTKAFDEAGMLSVETGSGFIWGSADISGRIATLHTEMMVNKSGKPRLRIVVDNCPELCRQLTKCLKDGVGQSVNDYKHRPKQQIDLVHCLEYWVSRNPIWVPPEAVKQGIGDAMKNHLEEIKFFDRKKKKPGAIVLGPKG